MTRVTVLFAALLLAAPGFLPAQEGREAVDAIFDRIEKQGAEGLAEGLREIESLPRTSLDDIRRGLTRADGFVRIAAARSLYSRGLRDEALQGLATVVRGKALEPRRLAADLSASLVGADPSLAPAEKRRIALDLEGQAGACDDPLTRVSLWRAVWALTGGMKPVRELREILGSAAPAPVREEAALALAEADRFMEARATLSEMASRPGERGRLAAAYLRMNALAAEVDRQRSLRVESSSKYDFTMLQETLDILKDYYHDESKIESERLVEAAIRGACASLDPYTTYMDAKAIDHLKTEELGGQYGGIGARVAMRKDKGGRAWLTIEEPIFSGPAYRAGLRSNDTIVEVTGEPTADRELLDLVRLLRGKAGTDITFKVFRRGWDKERAFTVVRERIQLETTMHRTLPGGIGYVSLSTFGPQDVDLVRDALKDLRGLKALVFDLRGNTGGYLRTAEKIAGYFLDEGQMIVSTRGRGVELERRVAADDKVTALPLVILVNGSSASASEILAGALQDHKRAILVGQRTFGKGSVQDLKPLKADGEKSAVKVTISKWYLPSGRTVQADAVGEGGVVPDIEVPLSEPEYWKLAEFERLRAGDQIAQYIQAHHDAALYERIAESDGGSTDLYPEFDALYESLDTKASRDEIRELVREFIRKRVQDERGQPLYLDFQTDIVLQRGILEACKLAHVKAEEVPEYVLFAAATEMDVK